MTIVLSETFPCVVLELQERFTWAAWPQAPIGRSLIRNSVHILQVHYTSLFVAELCMTPKLTYLMTAYYTPKDGFTVNDASFYNSKID